MMLVKPECNVSSIPIQCLHCMPLPPSPSSQDGNQYEKDYKTHQKSSLLDVEQNWTSVYGQTCYDATWALAFALNKTITGNLSVYLFVSLSFGFS